MQKMFISEYYIEVFKCEEHVQTRMNSIDIERDIGL